MPTYESTDELFRAANLGMPDAQYELAEKYEHGLDGLPNDPAKAFALYQQAAESGVQQAMLICARAHFTGNFKFSKAGVPVDLKKAVQWCDRMMALHQPFNTAFDPGEAHFLAGEIFATASPLQNLPRAFGYYKSAALTYGNALAAYEYAACLIEGQGTTKNAVEGMEMLRDMMLNTDISYQARAEKLCQTYNIPITFPLADDDVARRAAWQARWKAERLRQASDAGNADATWLLFKEYSYGVLKDDKERAARIFALLETLIAAGDVPALYEMYGFRLTRDGDVYRDSAESLRCLQMAADKGYPKALSTLAYLYFDGELGLPQDFEQCARTLERAVANEDARGMILLAKLLKEGWGVKRDETRAHMLERRALTKKDVDTYMARTEYRMLNRLPPEAGYPEEEEKGRKAN